jgi:taurine transport system permease protein
MGLRTRLETRVLWPVLGIAALLVVWQAASAALGTIRLPSPTSLWPDVFTDLHENTILAFQGGGSDGLLPHLEYTIRQTLLGAAIGICIGITLGLLMARSWIFRGLVEVPVEIFRTVPPLAAIPFFLIWLGPTQGAQLSMVSFYVTVMLTVITVNAAANLDPVYRRFARTLGASENRVFRTVVLPAILPEISGGIRVAVGTAWGIEVVSELLGAPQGMGTVFDKMVTFQGLDVIIIGIFWVTIAAVATDVALVRVMRYFTRWSPTVT